MKRFSWGTLLMLVGSAWLVQPAFAGDVIPSAETRFAQATDEVPSFQRHVLPLMGRLGCNGRACHGSFQGQGGFRLSLFGYDFKTDHEALLAGEEPRVDLKNPAKSLMLDKPASDEADYHGGGKRMSRDSWQYRLLSRWVEAGAPPTDENKDPHFVRLEVSPLEILFTKVGEKAKLRVLSHWSDGSVEDVTALCRFQTNDDAVAKVDLNGEISIVGKGDTHIVTFYDNGVVPVAVLLPQSEQVGPKYPQIPTPTKVDELVVTKLRKLGIVQAETCTDAEFLRRVSLDITGQLPTSEEVRAFLADASANKRTRKIDELLERPAHAAWWATKFADFLGNSENQLRRTYSIGSASEQWYRWLNARLAENMPYDKLVEGIVLATSRTSEKQSFQDYCREVIDTGLGKADFTERETMPWYWARQNMRKPNEKALSFSYAFLGVRLQCAECHKHPFDQWSQQDFQQFTAFFNRVNYGITDRKASDEMLAKLGIQKTMNNNDRQRLAAKAAQEGKLIPFEEVYITPARNVSRSNKDKTAARIDASRVLTPKVLGGEEVVETEYADPRQPLMQWLRQKDNPYFARALVNRVWSHYFNVGIVEPPDDMNLANAPSNKELLDWLAAEFIEHGYDLKWLHRTIAGSRTYQLSWHTNETNEFDLRNFSHSVPRRLQAEVVLDAVVTATAGETELESRSADPVTHCSIGLARGYTQRNNGSGSAYALTVFGKPKRETPCDCERSNEPSLLQTVYLRNDQEMFRLMDRNKGWIDLAEEQLDAKSREAELASARQKVQDIERQSKTIAERLAVVSKERKKKDEARKLQDEQKKLVESLKSARAKLAQLEDQKVVAAAPADVIREAYLRTFSRFPTDSELASAEQYLSESESPVEGLRDLVWALVNSKEFLVNH